jgi:hypothetical protein
MVAGSELLGWQVRHHLARLLMTAALAVVGLSWFVAWLIVDAI